MSFSLNGGKESGKKREQTSFNQTTTNTLSPRAAGLLSGGIADLKGKTYSPLDLGRVQAFQDPYGKDVRDATMGQLAYDRDVARNGMKADYASRGAFGDDRRGIYEAELDGQFDRTAAATLAGLNSAGYAQALSAAMAENQGRNDYDMQTQDLITRLLSMFGNEGTQTGAGSSLGKTTTSGYSFGGSWSPFAK